MRNVECPQCNSHSRHRNLYLWINGDYSLKSKDGVALIFAPERCFDTIWNREAAHLHSYRVDIEALRGVDILADMQKLPFARDSIDFIWCHHVLPEIPDDGAAIAELHRVLRPQTGELILSVGMSPDSSTHEFGHANKELIGLWRVYGQDFTDKLRAGGLKVKHIKFNVPPEISERHGVATEEDFYICVKSVSS
jgi:SAM-dependent methyltransferase